MKLSKIINNPWYWYEYIVWKDKKYIFRFVFNKNGVLKDVSALTADNFQQIAFSSDKTKVRRDAYSITDQLYDAFTRGQ